MSKRGLVASGFVSLFAIAGCSSDASGPSMSSSGTSGSGGTAVAGSSAAGASGSPASAGAGGSGVGGSSAGTSSAGTSGSSAVGGASGASAGTGGSTGGSSGASGGVGGGSAACAYQFCADFEGAAPGTADSDWKIDVDKKGTVVEAVTGKAHGGTHSVHVKVSDMAGVFGYITETKSLAATGASFWGRVFIWSEVATPAGHIVNVAIDGKSGTTDEQVRIFNVINGKIAINRRSDDKGGVSNVAPTMGKWQCYEWHITPNTLDVYLDSTKLPISQTWDEPTISLLRVGFERFTAGSAGELWLDDVALNDAPIGCN